MQIARGLIGVALKPLKFICSMHCPLFGCCGIWLLSYGHMINLSLKQQVPQISLCSYIIMSNDDLF